MKKTILIALLCALHCASPKKDDSTKKTNDQTNQNATSKETTDEFINPKEGFLNGSTFQIVVYSLQADSSIARSDALDVAKRKSLNMLISNTKQPLSAGGRTEIKSIVEESGKIIKESGLLDGKYYFIYQIQKPGLQIFITEKIH